MMPVSHIDDGPEPAASPPQRDNPAAVAKLLCAFASGAFRDLPARLQLAVPIVAFGPPSAEIYKEHGGTGHAYYTLRYRSEDPVTKRITPRSMYLGVLSEDHFQWAKDLIAARRQRQPPEPKAPSLDVTRIRMLKRLLNQAHGLARKIGASCGFRFRGMWMMRIRA